MPGLKSIVMACEKPASHYKTLLRDGLQVYTLKMMLLCAQVSDMALEDYIAVKPKTARYVPHTAGRYQKKRFRKAQCPIVERYAATLASSSTTCPSRCGMS